ncbi:Holliday junction resolvase RuvX [Auraticoccus monumenti]|uniref:Putative pre-16S rRNA nuclease n=1 Tax=Auraticoccus monumenti TaxID=675864 RepID=A0A1G7BCD5_9ACTN|nr:Holliday junction resolvase RuvX [Auraticoccus monumenti]SDE24006.1 putative holliday junction resolvase [Auraticoccus monumenti]
MRTGVRLGLDWGKARIGVARCDAAGTLAFPVTTVRAGRDAYAEVAALVAEHEAVEVVLGLPLALDGTEARAATDVRDHAVRLARRLEVPVRLVDERLSTVQASRGMRSAGRDSRAQRALIDQAAAVEILERALDAERRSGRPPGELLAPRPDAPPPA